MREDSKDVLSDKYVSSNMNVNMSEFHVFLFMYLCTGLSHFPRSDKAELIFSLDDVETYLKYTKVMKDFLAPYDIEKQRDQMKFEDCGGIRLHIFLRLLESQMHMDVLSAGSFYSLAYKKQNTYYELYHTLLLSFSLHFQLTCTRKSFTCTMTYVASYKNYTVHVFLFSQINRRITRTELISTVTLVSGRHASFRGLG